LTANALVGDRQLFIDAGMDDYLAKPLEPAELIQKIASLIGDKQIV
jgi:CheY-like chemotaxis protein